MGHWSKDFKHGIRVIRNHPGVYLTSILTLAIALAAATTMFSIVNAVLLRPLPYTQPERLGLVWDQQGDSPRDLWLSPPEFSDLREQTSAFQDVAALTDRKYTVSGFAEPDELQAVAVSPGFFSIIGAAPRSGRGFRPADEVRGAHVAIVSEPIAERYWGSAARAVGRALTLDGQTCTVVGVLPRTFSFWPPSAVFPKRVDVWVPIEADTYVGSVRTQNFLHVLVRLRDGVSFAQASADLARASERIERTHAEVYKDQHWRMRLVNLQEHLVRGVRPGVLILSGAVGFLLLIACANIASLLLARSGTRMQEMAVRTALGANRGRLLGQVLVESGVLALIATAVGILLSIWIVAWIAHAGPVDVPRLAEVTVDRRVLLFSAALALLSTLVFGAAPAVQLSRSHAVDQLKEGLRGSTSGPATSRVRGFFVVVEIALALALTISTGLLLKAFVRLAHADAGFSATDLATGRIRLPPSKYPQADQRSAFFDQVTRQLAQRADIRGSGAVTQLPMSGAFLGSSFEVPPGESDQKRGEFGADLRGITPGYFETMGIRVSEGRAFDVHDSRDSRSVAVIDETLARQFWPGADPIGRHIRWVRSGQSLEVVGVVAAVRHYGVAAPARETVYRPYSQYANIPEMFVVARSRRGYDAARSAIVQEVHRLDPDQPVAELRSVDGLVEESMGQPRFNTILLSIFAAIALMLAATGVYAVMSFAVAQRIHEIGIRMALGADRRSVLRMVVRSGASLALAGLCSGLVVVLPLARALETLLFGISPFDPLIYLGVSALLLSVTLIASYIPARRAADLDPSIALRRA